jgi:ribosome-associated translation inhibitor RaiA
MLKRNENKIRMFEAVLEVLNVNRGIWQGTALFALIVSKLGNSIKAIGETRKITGTDSKGKTLDKNLIETELIDGVGSLNASLYMLAKNTGNNVLMEMVNYTDGELQNAREGELIEIAETVTKIAGEHLDRAVEYDYNEAEVTAVIEKTTRFKAAKPTPRASIAERKAANTRLAQLIADAMDLLVDELDRMMTKYKNSNPDFYNAYYNARMIVGYGIRHEKKNGEETKG